MLAPSATKAIGSGDVRPTVEFHRWCNEVTRALAATGTVTLDYPSIVRTNLPPSVQALAASGTTDGVPEGLSNRYFTDERVDDRVAALLVQGANITLTYDDTLNTLTMSAASGSAVPTLIADGQTFAVATNTQVLFSQPIELGTGSFLSVEGYLLEVA